MRKSRSNTMAVPRASIDGHSTRPSAKRVICLAGASAVVDICQMFSIPVRSETKNSDRPSPAHIGHNSFAPPLVSARHADGLSGADRSRSQISDSSRWLWPCRHHCPDALPRAVIASVRPSGEAAEKNSLAYRSPLTGMGVPPSAETR